MVSLIYKLNNFVDYLINYIETVKCKYVSNILERHVFNLLNLPKSALYYLMIAKQ